jgi:hypothetical protein
MNYSVDMDSGALIYVQSIVKNCEGIRKWIGENICTYEQDYGWNLFLFFK